MHPALFAYEERSPQLGVGVAPPGSVTVESGVQRVTPDTQGTIMGYLSTLHVSTAGQQQPPVPGVAVYQAIPCADVEAAGGICGVSALQLFQAAPATTLYMVNVTSASQNFVEVYAASATDVLPLVAAAGSDYAVIDFSPAAAPTEKKETPYGTKVLGLVAGGAAGFFYGGPIGAAIGAGVGYVAADAIG